jgi:seryl-tRNA synthetase
VLDRRIFREQPDAVRENLRRRGQHQRLADVDRMVTLDEDVRALGVRADDLRRRSKDLSAQVGKALKAGQAADADKDAVRRTKDELEGVEASERALEAERFALELTFENLLLPQVETGRSSEDNVVMRTWGAPPALDFTPRAHDDLGEALGILDFARGAKVAGARFTFVVGDGARLEHALIRFMRDVHAEHGDVEMLPPLLVNDRTLTGTGQLPKFEADLFRVSHESPLYLIPTSEVPVTNFHADEILEAAELPKRYFAYSPCFRSEAGSYGKDVRGYIRQHHFNKVEMVRICTPAQSLDELELMTDRAQEILRRLSLHHRVVRLCSADTSFGSAMTYDIEVWLPSQAAFREISSCSSCTDFQARRAKIRFRPSPGARPEICHTLNGSGLAVGRTLVAILEQCQRADGSVSIPEALRPYFGAAEIRRA